MSPTCWILTDGRLGTENSARGLAEALGLDYTVIPIQLRQPWKSLSPWLRLGLRYAFKNNPLRAPWPDILITAGRTPAVGSLFIGQQSPGTFRIHITNPAVAPTLFDCVIAPVHDQLTGPNVITTTGALHRLTPDKLASAADHWRPRFAHLPRPWHGVLIGGSAHGYVLDADSARQFMPQIKALGGSLIATASRRTDPQARHVINQKADYLWNGDGDNPLLGILALADNLFVTADSVSMLTEAASSGRPTYMICPPGTPSAKLARFHAAMIGAGHLAQFTGILPESIPTPLNEMPALAARVRDLLIARGKLSV